MRGKDGKFVSTQNNYSLFNEIYKKENFFPETAFNQQQKTYTTLDMSLSSKKKLFLVNKIVKKENDIISSNLKENL